MIVVIMVRTWVGKAVLHSKNRSPKDPRMKTKGILSLISQNWKRLSKQMKTGLLTSRAESPSPKLRPDRVKHSESPDFLIVHRARLSSRRPLNTRLSRFSLIKIYIIEPYFSDEGSLRGPVANFQVAPLRGAKSQGWEWGRPPEDWASCSQAQTKCW